MAMPNGRPTSERTIRRQVRQVLGSHVPQLAEKALAKGLQGDVQALQVCADLLALAITEPSPKTEH